MKNFIRILKSYRLPLIGFGLAIVIAILFIWVRGGFKSFEPGEVVKETTMRTQSLFGGGFDFTDEEEKKAKPAYQKLRSGGPAKDGIPAIDNPKFISLKEAQGVLKSDDVVLGFIHNDEARVYPLRILNWHEIVNDTVGGTPVIITYCPLCYTGIAFERVIDGKETTFGTSGMLFNSNLVMYDRATDSLWTQLGGEAIIGKNLGKKLKQLPLDTLFWSEWMAKHPDTKVLSFDTGFVRNYDLNPYEDFETSRDTFGTQFEDERLSAKEKVWGLEIEGKFKAYPMSVLLRKNKFKDNFAGRILLVTSENRGGSVRIVDENSGQEFVPTISYWFSWVAFHPETELYK